MMSNQEPVKVKTQMATLDVDTITVRGHNLVEDLIGKIDVADLFFLEVTAKLPTKAESKLLNAMIVAIAEHGMMPSVIAARLTLMGAPESFQGAVASGLLGAGDVFVGPTSNVARMLQVDAAKFTGSIEERAEQVVAMYTAATRKLPGLGQPHHPVDPRAMKLFEMQKESGMATANTELMFAIHRVGVERLGRSLTLNATAAIGAICSDMGLDWRAVRGIGLIARTVGIIGHLMEEIRDPQSKAIWDLVQHATEYSDPTT
jgi:citrate synthase